MKNKIQANIPAEGRNKSYANDRSKEQHKQEES